MCQTKATTTAACEHVSPLLTSFGLCCFECLLSFCNDFDRDDMRRFKGKEEKQKIIKTSANFS